MGSAREDYYSLVDRKIDRSEQISLLSAVLGESYPATDFAIKSSSNVKEGMSINIYWIGGPAEAAVKELIAPLAGGTRNELSSYAYLCRMGNELVTFECYCINPCRSTRENDVTRRLELKTGACDSEGAILPRSSKTLEQIELIGMLGKLDQKQRLRAWEIKCLKQEKLLRKRIQVSRRQRHAPTI